MHRVEEVVVVDQPDDRADDEDDFGKEVADASGWVTVRLDPSAGFLAAHEEPLDYCFVAVHSDDVDKLRYTRTPLAIDPKHAETLKIGVPITICSPPRNSPWSLGRAPR